MISLYTQRISARISPKAILLAVLVLCIIVLAIRGCAMSRGGEAPLPQKLDTADDMMLTVYLDDSGKTVSMGLEEYIVHAVAGEMPASFETEALKAQAVAARTYAARRALKGSPCGRGGADICTDSGCCQSFAGEDELRRNWADAYAINLARIEAAVYSTRGIIALYEGEPIEALYHSCSGGMTEDSANVFGSAPYLIGVASPNEEAATRFKASERFSRREFARTVNGAYPDAKLSARKLETQVETLDTFASGRVERIRLGGVTLTGREFRALFSLNSANFELEYSKDSVTVSTLGYGHGVGMSQYGANAMAQRGATYEEILLHYYTGITLGSACE